MTQFILFPGICCPILQSYFRRQALKLKNACTCPTSTTTLSPLILSFVVCKTHCCVVYCLTLFCCLYGIGETFALHYFTNHIRYISSLVLYQYDLNVYAVCCHFCVSLFLSLLCWTVCCCDSGVVAKVQKLLSNCLRWGHHAD